MIVNSRSDVLAWNAASSRYFTEFSSLPLQERNMTWQWFSNDSLRERISNWEECAGYAAAVFRSFCDRNAGDPWVSQFVPELMSRSPFFQNLWGRYEVRGKSGLVIRFEAGESFEVTSLQLNQGTKIFIFSYVRLYEEVPCHAAGKQKKMLPG